ncbi:hypothetical protein BUE93_20830 [Chromobacterium amazonense]|uniref:Uncharacterized protein n=1 Tax=Chromobacterium amazonense TaxID=1382803 RepID=A0A2S9WZ25_9NEIS|nr:hypothetical protein [Chromobacterium amazonense]PRP68713.1 hypothetical protein BUE93_20830 [Chromobacterium amazonense]
MHMEHAKAVYDACHLRHGQHVLMATGRAAKVGEIGQTTIRFDYLERNRPDDCVIIPRHKVPEMVRV